MQARAAHFVHVRGLGLRGTVDVVIAAHVVLQGHIPDNVLHEHVVLRSRDNPGHGVLQMRVVSEEVLVHLDALGEGVRDLNLMFQRIRLDLFDHVLGVLAHLEAGFLHYNQRVLRGHIGFHPVDGVVDLGGRRGGGQNHRVLRGQRLGFRVHRRDDELALRQQRESAGDVRRADRTDDDIALLQRFLHLREVLGGVHVQHGYVHVHPLLAQVAGGQKGAEVEIEVVRVRARLRRERQEQRDMDLLHGHVFERPHRQRIHRHREGIQRRGERVHGDGE